MGKNMKLAGLAAGLTAVLAVVVSGTGRTASTGNNPDWRGSLRVEGKTGLELVGMAALTIQRAMAIGFKESRGGRIRKAELKVEKGSLVYIVQVISPRNEAMKVVIDANTRNVLSVEPGDLDKLGTAAKEEKGGK